MTEKLFQQLKDYAPNLLYALIILAVGYLVIKLVIKLLRTGFKRTKLDETGWAFLISLIRAVLYVILIVMILSQLKVPMSSIVAALGTAGLAIGLALKESLSNVAGGFMIMFTRPFKVGDFVEISQKEGFVDRISIINTRLLTIDNKAVIIPNASVTTATITNYTAEEERRLELELNVSYECDFRRAEEIIKEVAAGNELTLKKHGEPYVRVSAHSGSSVTLLLRVWVKTSDYWELRFGLLADIKDAFDREGIEIPYEQLDVHIDSAEKAAK